MTAARDTSTSRRPAPRGRIDKRQSILSAAFTVFARQGYPQSSVDEIAAEAGVAKATVYNHFGDKETLLRQAITASADEALAQNLATVDRLREVGTDPRAKFEEVGHELLRCYCTPESWALRRLLFAEVHRAPDLLDIIHDRAMAPVNTALADRLARLTLAGTLRANDPAIAAEQFTALLTGPIDDRSRLGTRPLPDDELHELARQAVDTFLLAFAGPR